MPEALELWALADDGDCEVHPYARVKLCSEFREENFQTLIFNARRFQIPLLGRRALNASVEFLDIVRFTQHVESRVDYTENTFINYWGVNTTDTIPTNFSTIIRRAYEHIVLFTD